MQQFLSMIEHAPGLSEGQVDVPQEIIDIAHNLRKTEDVSTYAAGRLRCWVPTEPPLGPSRPWQHGDMSDAAMALFGWAVWTVSRFSPDFVPELMLVTDSTPGAIGIAPHRDASYADYEAWGINIYGDAVFTYTTGYPQYCWSRNQLPAVKHEVKCTAGTVLQFNCKNTHAALPMADRLSLQLWRVSRKAQEAYESFLGA